MDNRIDREKGIDKEYKDAEKKVLTLNFMGGELPINYPDIHGNTFYALDERKLIKIE